MKKTLIIPALLLLFAACKKSETAPAPVPAPAVGHDTTIIQSLAAKVFEKDISAMTWTTVGNANNGYLKLTISAPQVLTQEALDSNVALVYVYTSDFNGWGQLPYHTDRNINVTADVSAGQIILKKQQDGKPYTQSWHNTVRVVLVPTTSTGVLQKQAHP